MPSFASVLAGVLLCACLPARAAAQPLLPSAQASAHAPSLDVRVARSWLDHEVERARRQQLFGRWLLPALSGVLGSVSMGLAVSGEQSPRARYVDGAGAALSLSAMNVAYLLDRPHARAWSALGVSLATVGVGASAVVDGYARAHDSDRDPSGPPVLRWFGAAAIVCGVGLLPAMWLDPGPSAEEFRAAAALAEEDQLAQTLRLLARADRAERLTRDLTLLATLGSTGITLAGAASVDDAGARMELLRASLVFAVPSLLTLLPSLFRKSRVESALGRELPRTPGFHW